MDQTVPVTETVVFVCVGQGYGIVNVSWHRMRRKNNNYNDPPDRSIVNTVVTPDLINSTLTIPELRDRNNRDNYRCRYNNSEGETFSNPATLTIGCK